MPSAHSAAKNAYTTAQSYLNDHPNGSITSVGILTAYGYRHTTDVVTNVSGSQDTLQITTYRSAGSRTYTVDSEGAM